MFYLFLFVINVYNVFYYSHIERKPWRGFHAYTNIVSSLPLQVELEHGIDVSSEDKNLSFYHRNSMGRDQLTLRVNIFTRLTSDEYFCLLTFFTFEFILYFYITVWRFDRLDEEYPITNHLFSSRYDTT